MLIKGRKLRTPIVSDAAKGAKQSMEDAGVSIARNPSEIADALLKIYKG